MNHKKSSSKSQNPARNVKTEKTGKNAGKNAALPDKKEHKKDKTKSGNNNFAGKQAKPIPNKVVPPMPEIIPVPQQEGKMRFQDLPLRQEVLAAVQDLGFSYCTKIQEQCLPHSLDGKDLAAKAQTGTGKTAAFLAATISRLLQNPKTDRKPGTCRVLVLAPTRELAIQIQQDSENLAKYSPLYNLVIFGGMDHKEQRDALSKPVDILVGTPGRIIDYSRSGHLDLSDTETLIIDEADRMLDMGFIPDVSRIVRQLPPPGTRQTMLFSATLDPEILRMIRNWLHDPISLESEPERVVTDLIEQRFYAVLDEEKLPMLLHLIRTEKPERLIIFGNRKDKIRSLVRQLYEYGVDAELLSGDVAQEKRLKILDRFRSGQCKVLVATDVAARGIHVEGISHVVNFDLPEQPDDYVHRIGRTGRAGESGISISFVCEYGAYVLPDIEKYAGMEIRTTQPEPEMLILPEKTRKAPPPPQKNFSAARRNNSGNRKYHHFSGRKP